MVIGRGADFDRDKYAKAPFHLIVDAARGIFNKWDYFAFRLDETAGRVRVMRLTINVISGKQAGPAVDLIGLHCRDRCGDDPGSDLDPPKAAFLELRFAGISPPNIVRRRTLRDAQRQRHEQHLQQGEARRSCWVAHESNVLWFAI
jgi:hypothetical protein